MRRLFLVLGGIAIAAALLISMSLNYLFGSSLGQTPARQYLFGGISVVADIWKGLGPIYIYALWHRKRPSAAIAGSLVWIACFAYAVTSALGLAVNDRMTLTGGREALQSSYLAAQSELTGKQARRDQLAVHRTSGEVEAAIAVALAQPVRSGERLRGTVGTVSDSCLKVGWRTADACAAIASLKQELAIARVAAGLEEAIAGLRLKVDRLRERGGALNADPQAEFLSKLSRRWLSPSDIGLGLILLLAAVLELVSAFGPVILAAYAQTIAKLVPADIDFPCIARSPSRPGRPTGLTSDDRTVGQVLDYMAERIEPARNAVGLGADDLVADYQAWCRGAGLDALEPEVVISEFDEARHEHRLADQIGKFGRRYYGIQFVTRKVAKLAGKGKG